MAKNIDEKQNIQEALKAFGTYDLSQAGINLFSVLGYDTSLQAPLDNKTYQEFRETYIESSPVADRFSEEKALVNDWKSIDILFQLTSDSFTNQGNLFEPAVNPYDPQSYLCFAVELIHDEYTKSNIANITREINKLFSIPIIIIYKYGVNITLAVINRRVNKKDSDRDVLEKVTLIKDIIFERPHRAHIEILFDMSLPQLSTTYTVNNFETLHKAWSEVLDTQTLNKRFYTELSNWYFWAIKTVVYPGYEMEAERNGLFTKEEKLREHNAKNLIRLLTRLLFVWFIKEKDLIPEELFDENKIREIITKFTPEYNTKDKNSDPESVSIYYKAILQNLFFASLNAEHGKRAFRIDGQNQNATSLMRYKRYHKNPDEFVKLIESKVPFMNGGLFECLDHQDDEKKGKKGGALIDYEDGFSDRKDNELFVPDYIFFGKDVKVDLSTEYDDKKKKDVTVNGIINILQKYKFTIAENTPVEEDIALDPELLGRVFENLLASYNPETKTNARKQTGSFYTPRPIVEYMVDESLKAYLKTKLLDSMSVEERVKPEVIESTENKLSTLIAYNEAEVDFTAKEKRFILECIDNCKILDPACGSGAFPMGILQKIVYVIHKLDNDNRNWKTIQADKIEDDKSLTKEEKASLIADMNAVFDNNELDYARKLYLIENCIHGIDIQPIATQISRLRFFISLIVDQTVDPKKANFGVRPLPNLENRFVTANSLIGLNEETSTLFDSDIEPLMKRLAKVRHQIFSIKNPKRKFELKQEDKQIRLELEQTLVNLGFGKENARLISTWDPYDKNKSAEFFDAEWMFGIKDGFDIVIGNPPYVESRNSSFSDKLKDELQKQISQNYSEAEKDCFPRGADLLIFFYELSFRLMKQSGVNVFITENAWLSTDYGRHFQDYLLNNIDVIGVIDSDYKYFENADINTVITIFKRKLQLSKSKIKLIHCHENLATINLSDFSNKSDIVEVNVYDSDDILLKKYKWGFLFKTDLKLINLLGEMVNKNNAKIAAKIEIGQGLNLTKNCILTQKTNNSVPYFISDIGPLYRWASETYWVDKNNVSKDRRIPIMILPRGLGTHFCCMNEINGYSASYVEIYEKEKLTEIEKLRLWIFCNSSLLWLLREYTGRCNLGGGMLKAEATDLKSLPLCFDFPDIEEMKSIFALAKNQKNPTKLVDSMNSEIHKRIDSIVYKYFGLPIDDNFVTKMFIDRFNWRNAKSKTK